MPHSASKKNINHCRDKNCKMSSEKMDKWVSVMPQVVMVDLPFDCLDDSIWSACQVNLLVDLAKSAKRNENDMHHKLLVMKWKSNFHASPVSESDFSTSLPS